VHSARAGKILTHIDPEAVEALMAYDWPGNIRELENVVERAVVLADGPSLTVGDLPPEVRQPIRRRYRPRGRLVSTTGPSAGSSAAPGASSGATTSERAATAGGSADAAGDEWNSEFFAYERQRLLDSLEEAGGNKSIAARLLGLPRSTFFSKLKKHGLA
jgi:DNA-binding NtrC family response regulator